MRIEGMLDISNETMIDTLPTYIAEGWGGEICISEGWD